MPTRPPIYRSDRVAVVLSGGGSKGDFQVGALKYLYEHVFSRADILCGTSVGAINATLCTEGEDESFAKLERLWLGLLRNSDMFVFEPEFRDLFERIGQQLQNLQYLIGATAMTGPLGLLTGVLPAASEILGTLRRAKQAHALSNLEPIRQIGRGLEGWWSAAGPGAFRGGALAVMATPSGADWLVARGHEDRLLVTRQPWERYLVRDHVISSDPAFVSDASACYGTVFRGAPNALTFLRGPDLLLGAVETLGKPPEVVRFVGNPSVSGFGADDLCILLVLGRAMLNDGTVRQLPYSRTFNRATKTWGPWLPAGAALLPDPFPTAATLPSYRVVDFVGRLAVHRHAGSGWITSVARGRDRQLYRANWTATTPATTWLPVTSGNADSDPTLVFAAGQLWLVFREAGSKRVFVAAAGPAADFSSAGAVGGRIVTGNISAVPDDGGRIHLFARDANGRIIHARQAASGTTVFDDWNELEADIALSFLTEPVAVPRPATNGGFDVFAVQQDDRVWHARTGTDAQAFRTLPPETRLWSGVRLRQAMVDMRTAELRYATEAGKLITHRYTPVPPPPGPNPSDWIGEPLVSIVDGAIASAAIPAVFRLERLGTRSYCDGGLRSVTPIEAAIGMGAETIFAVVASSPFLPRQTRTVITMFDGDVPRTPIDDYSMAEIIDVGLRTIGLFPFGLQQNELHPARGWPVPVTIIQPNLADDELHDAFTINPGTIRISIDYGFYRARDVVEGTSPLLRTLLDEITRKRVESWRLESRLLRIFIAQVVPSSGGRIGFLVREAANIALAIRATKRLIAEKLRSYAENGGRWLSDPRSWVTAWEANYYDWPEEWNGRFTGPVGRDLTFVAPSPWDAYFVPGGVGGEVRDFIPAEVPPNT